MLERGQALLTVSIDNLETAEYQQAYKAILRKDRQNLKITYVIVMFVFFFLAYWLFDRDPMAAGIVVAILLLLLGYFKWQEVRQVRAAGTRANKDLPVQIIFTENGMLGETQYGEHFRKWEGFAGYTETQGTIALAPTHRTYSVIPKRALDPATLASLQRLLQEKLKRL